jgi:hypothetical protein
MEQRPFWGGGGGDDDGDGDGDGDGDWQNSHFLAIAFLRWFCQICLESDHPLFTSLSFETIIFLQSKVVSLASNPQPGGPGLCIYVSRWQGSPVIPQGTGFPFHRRLRLAGLRWRCSNPPPHGAEKITVAQMIITPHVTLLRIIEFKIFRYGTLRGAIPHPPILFL